MPLYIHHPYGEVGLNFGYWVRPAFSTFLGNDMLYYDLRYAVVHVLLLVVTLKAAL